MRDTTGDTTTATTAATTGATWMRIAAIAWSAVVAVLLLLPLADLSSSSVFPVVQALWGAWLLTGLVTLAAWLGLRQWVAAAVVAVAMVVGWLPVALPLNGDPAPDATALTVVSANLEYSQADAATVADLARDHDADVLVLLEVSRGFLRRLRGTGLAADLPHGWERPVAGGAGGTTILTRVPQREETRWPDPFDYDFDLPMVRIDVEGLEVVVRAVHTIPPAPPPGPRWRAELRALDAWTRAVPDDTALVMAGDYNAARVHPAFREVADDFTVAPGPGSRTWPEERWYPPFVGIDHVLARPLVPLDSGSVAVLGSDHRAVWARLALPAD